MAKILELNLIKSKIKVIETRRQYSRYSRIIYFIAISVFVGISFNFYTLTKKLLKAQNELSAIERSIEEKRKAFSMEDTEKIWQDYCKKLRSVYSVVSARSAWGAKFKEFANLLPPGMCIDRIEVTSDQNKKTFFMEIITLPNEQKGFKDIENFITNLEADRFIGKGVKLESHERKHLNKTDVEVFKIYLPQGEVRR